MRLTPEELRRVADLARIDLADDEAERLAVQLGEILDRIDGLEDGDHGPAVADGPGAAPPTAGGEVTLRADLPSVDPLVTAPETMAPGWADGFFVVPRLASHDDGDDGGDDREGAS